MKKWLEKFGLTYYGCCEPLHNKIEILQQVKNLRKISISPRADIKIAAKKFKIGMFFHINQILQCLPVKHGTEI